MHDTSDFAEHFLALLKNDVTGVTGVTATVKSLNLREKIGTCDAPALGHVQKTLSWHITAACTNKSEEIQPVINAVTGGTPVTNIFNTPSHDDQSADSPAEWNAYLGGLREREAVDWMTDQRWSEVISDADNFLLRWGDAAKSLGWTMLDLLGVHPTAPAARVGMMGLLLFVHSGAVVALTAGSATIRRPSQAILIYRRHDTTGAVLISEAAA